MLPAQHTTFNTLDNWAIKTPPNQKGKGPERKGYRVRWPQNMYTIHSVTSVQQIANVCVCVCVCECVCVCVCVCAPCFGSTHMCI